MPLSHARKGTLRLAAGMMLLAGAMVFAPSHAAAQDKVHALNELSDLPKLANVKQAAGVINDAYPRKLQRDNVGGKVQLKFIVNADGSVDAGSIEVIAAAVEELGEAAKEAAAGLKFVPGKVGGAAVRTAVVFPISFGVG